MKRLDGRTCIVTGAGSRAEGIGNGRAAAVLFAREGANVLVCDRDAAAAQVTLDMIESEGGSAAVFVGDLTDPAQAHAMAAAALDRWGCIDVLDNNIGIDGGGGSVIDTAAETWDLLWDVNVMTMVNASRAVIPSMAAAGRGSIINIASISAFRPRGLTAYSASKGAVIALSRAMAIDHAEAGIRVNCISPGPVYTPNVYADGMTEERRERRRLASPLKVEGTGWDVAYAALFFACDESRWITGVHLPVDGGVSIMSPPR